MRYLTKLWMGAIIALSLIGCSNAKEKNPMHSLGENPSIRIDVFSDIQCPTCAEVIPQIASLITSKPQLGELNYYHYPLSQHPLAFLGAQATECAEEQGAFWDFLNLSYQGQQKLTEDDFYKMVKTLNLDSTDFKTCLNENRYREKVAQDVQRAQQLNISATPTILINGEVIQWNGIEAFKKQIDKAG